MFCKKVVLRNFAKFTEKYLCQSLFGNKIGSLRPATLLKKRLWHLCFSVSFAKFLRTTFLLVAASEPVRLSSINTIFSFKKVFVATKIQKQPPQVFCKRSFIIRKTFQYCEVFKNTYFEKHLWAGASENQCLSDKFTSSSPEVLCKTGVLRNFAKFTVKHLCQSLLFNKVAGLRL